MTTQGAARSSGAAGAKKSARQLAHVYGSGLPAHVDEGDLVSYGLLGLIVAIERYEKCVGAIGVAGGSFEFDARVAREAVESIGASAGE